jgi:hypothetical protein
LLGVARNGVDITITVPANTFNSTSMCNSYFNPAPLIRSTITGDATCSKSGNLSIPK